ncbi:MAG: sigma-70 family RNA polymerase sigma factor [Calditrichaeota bacterium]|jgi:RNA polymerase sigma-70 factor, ECF subfamily|nr:sigma-70 family RNA polymerase sigma factor [Calditrichota bacterium]MBT7615838.1 sigma-70 family RNA polymerase sigma factor [Calditrichota bacterium]
MGGQNRYPDFDLYAVKLIRTKSRQLCKQPDFSLNDRLDIEQDLMIELTERLPTYDPDRASEEAFITWVVLQRIADLIRSQRTKKRRIDVEATSLNDLVYVSESGSKEEQWATLDNEIFQEFTGSDTKSHNERIDLEIDLERVMNGLPEDLNRLCEFLSKYSISETARRLGVSRTTLYKSIHKLHEAFEQAGMKDYL